MPTAFTLKVSSNECDALMEDLSAQQSRENNSNTTDGNSAKDMSQNLVVRQEVEAVRERSEEALAGQAWRASDMGYKTSTDNNGSTDNNSYLPREEAPRSDFQKERSIHLENSSNLFFPQQANLQLLEKSLLPPGSSLRNTTATASASATTTATNHSINLHMTHGLPHRLSDENSSLVTASSILNHMKQLSTMDESMNTPSLPSTTGPKNYPHHEHLNQEHNTTRTTSSIPITTTSSTTPSIHQEKERTHGILNGHEASMRERMAAYHRLQSRMTHVTHEKQENVDLMEQDYCNHHTRTTSSSHIHKNNNGSLAHHTSFHPFSDYSLHPTMRAQMNHNSIAVPRNLDYPYLNGYLQLNSNYQTLVPHPFYLPNHNTTTAAAPLLQRHSNLQQDHSLLMTSGPSGPLAMGNNDPSRARFMNTPVGLGYVTTEQTHMNSINHNHMGFIMQPPHSFPNYHQGLDYTYPTSERPESLSNTMVQRNHHPLQPQNSHLSLLQQQQQQPLLQCTDDLSKQEQDMRGSLSLPTMDQMMPTIDQENLSDGSDCFEEIRGIRRSGQLSGVYRYYVPKTGKEERSIKSTEHSSLATSSLISYHVRMPDIGGHQVSPKSWTHKSHTSTSSRASTRTHLVSLKELNATPCYKDPMKLGVEEDNQHLSKFLQFLRAECCEVFTASEDDVFQRRKSKQIRLHQVGIRCALCANKAYHERTLRSSCYPSSFDRIYQSVTMMIRDHFSDCPHYSESMRMKYDSIKASSVRKGNYEAKSYWIKSAQSLGIVETDEGLFFLK